MSTPNDPRFNQPNPDPGQPGPNYQSSPPQGYGPPQGPGYPGQGPQPGYGTPQPPYGGQPGPSPQDPYAAQPGYPPQDPYGGQPGYDPYGMPQQPAPKKNLPLIIAGVVVAVLVIGVGIAFAMGAFSPKKKDAASQGSTQAGAPSPGGESSAGGEEDSQAPAGKPETPKAAVEAYLNAVAKGDAKAALAVVDPSSIRDDSLLTDEVLKDSLSRTPITDIKVFEPEGSEYSPTVKVSYKLGDEVVEDEYRITGKDNQIFSPMLGLSLHSVHKLKPLVNGVEAKTDRPDVFPGSYVVTSSNEYLEVVVNRGEFPIVAKHSKDYDLPLVEAKVSQAGIDLYREKVVPEAKACLASPNLDPGCDMAMSDTLKDGEKLTDGTVERNASAEAMSQLENVEPRAGFEVPTIISSSDFGYFRIEADCTDANGNADRCRVIGGPGSMWSTASIDLTDPELKVTWKKR